MLYKIKIGVALTIIALALFLFWQNRSLIEEKAEQAAIIIQQRATLADRDRRIADLAQQRKAAEAVAAREKARSVDIYSRVKDLRDEILRMERNMEDVMAWADTAMPAELDSLLMGPADDRPD